MLYRTSLPLLLVGSFAVVLLTACGGASGPEGTGSAVGSQVQSITFAGAPALELRGSATVHATASSGLPVRYASDTPAICAVEEQTGLVNASAPGICTVAATQAGDRTWAAAPRATLNLPVGVDPRQSITFGTAPTLRPGDTGAVTASASSGLPVRYTSGTPQVCTVGAENGHVTALAVGNCSIVAAQAGNDHYQAAQATLTVVIAPAGAIQPPGAPQQVSARTGRDGGTVEVDAGLIDSGGSAIIQYTVTSTPPGITQTAASLPVTVVCPASDCSGYSFALRADNAAGSGLASTPADVITDYDIVVKFKEPDYLHDLTEFHGRFRYNATQLSVSQLQGELSEVMAGNNQPGQPYPDGMPLLTIAHQLSAVPAPERAGRGLLVTSFLHEHTNTLSNDPRDGGSDGFSPGTGAWKYWGYAGGTRTAPNPGNAYIRIYVNPVDPTRQLTQAQIDTLAYADCAAEGMMGDDCMTGTTRAGYGVIGSMGGYPISQTVTRRD